MSLGILLLVVSRVQTGTVSIFRCQMKCACYPAEAWSRAGGFPCGYGWVRVRGAVLVEAESASPVMELFSCRACKSCEGLKKRQTKEVGIVQLPCTCTFFHPHNAPPWHLRDRSPPAPHPMQTAEIVLNATKPDMYE